MAAHVLANQTAPTTPSSGFSTLWIDSTTKKLVQTDDAGLRHGSPLSKNFSTAAQGPGLAVDTYVTNSGILIPSFGMEAGQLYRWIIGLSKTAVGTGSPVVTFRVGSNQSTADTSRGALTGAAGTAAAAGGQLIAHLLVRSVSATGVVTGAFGFTAGILSFGSGQSGTGAAFDNSALAGQFVGLSVNFGASANVTIDSVYAELVS